VWFINGHICLRRRFSPAPSVLSPGRRGGARGGCQPRGVRGGLRGRWSDQRARPAGALARCHSAGRRCQQDGPGQSGRTKWGCRFTTWVIDLTVDALQHKLKKGEKPKGVWCVCVWLYFCYLVSCYQHISIWRHAKGGYFWLCILCTN